MIEPITIIDFPWRFLGVTTFCGSFLAGYLVYKINYKYSVKHLFISILIIGVFYTNRNHVRVNQYTDIPLSLYLDSELTSNTDDEYLPEWVNREYARGNHDLVENKLIQVKNIKLNSHIINFEYSATVDSTTDIFHMYFPGWVAFRDATNIPIQKNDKGGISINLIKGNHLQLLKYVGTPVMKIANLISVILLAVIIGYIVILKKFRINKK